ncbi:MAG TPA: hypothetical protein VIN59_09640 [Alphaproteobacteria bacterium]
MDRTTDIDDIIAARPPMIVSEEQARRNLGTLPDDRLAELATNMREASAQSAFLVARLNLQKYLSGALIADLHVNETKDPQGIEIVMPFGSPKEKFNDIAIRASALITVQEELAPLHGLPIKVKAAELKIG